MGHCEAVPSLTRQDGKTITNSEDKTSLLAEFFATKMKVSDMGRRPLHVPKETNYSVTEIQMTPEQVEQGDRGVQSYRPRRRQPTPPQTLCQ